MEKLFKIIDTNVATALGWTLIHSIWQIFAISLIYTILIKFEKRSYLRYWSGITLLFFQIILSLITFSIVYKPQSTLSNQLFTKQYFSTWIIHVSPDNQASIFQTILFFIESNLNNIVVFWGVGIAFLLLRLIFNFMYVNQLKSSCISKSDNQITEIFNNLLEKIQINKSVQLYESAKISLPIVIGYLKPIILIPVGLTTNLNQKQLEAIIAHELAHIKRNDFLINILQSIAEIIFFFHPALWWLSGQIREERENCCDDLAIDVIGERLHLVKALAQVETFRQNPVLAMAFGKKRFTLLERVQRILGMQANTNKTQETLFFVTILASIIAGYFVFQSNHATAQTSVTKPSQSPFLAQNMPKIVVNGVIVQDDTLSDDESIMQFFNGKTKVFVTKQGDIFINGKKHQLTTEQAEKVKKHIDELARLETKMKPYESELEKLSTEMEGFSEKMNLPSSQMEKVSKDMELQSKRMEEFSKQQERLMKKMSLMQEDSKQFKELEKQLEMNEKQFEKLEKEMSIYDMEMEKFEKEMEKNHAPMDSIDRLMEKYTKPMDEIGHEMEIHSKAIIEVLPYHVRKDIENGMDFTMPPPPPPVPSKVSRIAPVAPKARVSPPSKPPKVTAPKPPVKLNE